MGLTPRKVGRRANATIRASARSLVDDYRRAVAAGGSFVVNPESPPDEQGVFRAHAGVLLEALEHLAEHGTFESVDDWRPLVANAINRKNEDLPFEERMEKVGAAFNLSPRHAQRLISRSSRARDKGPKKQ
jgi:hypothetical protein